MTARVRYAMRYLLPRERRALAARLALAMEAGVLTWDEAFASYRREVPFWCLCPDSETQPLTEAPAPKEFAR